MATSDIGLVGLAVMGQNLALNIASKGFTISVFNRTPIKVDETVQRAKEEGNLPLVGFKDLKEFVNSIKKPLKVIILVKAGPAVDEIINQLTPLMVKGDMIIDGGNEWFENTELRASKMEGMGFRYMGMGVSGGEDGARHGPALMPGGSKDGYDLLKPIIEKIAAQVDDGPCVSYIGTGGSGNYVKMVHNGIEYGDMQLIAESYHLLKFLGGLDNKKLQDVFTEWNKGQLQSFLIEITADIFAQLDDSSEDPKRGHLVDMILDVAGSKGTGLWTVKEAAERGIPCPTIQAALDSRYLSSFKSLRKDAAKVFPKPPAILASKEFIADVSDALYCSKICSYAQGMMLLQKMSEEKKWGLNLGEIARGWKGGCIIRAKFLDRITQAYKKKPDLASLLLDPGFAAEIREKQNGWRRVVIGAQQNGISVPALSASLAYFDGCCSEKLPLSLVQAQRDYFGAHTYQRTDKEGAFHTSWCRITPIN